MSRLFKALVVAGIWVAGVVIGTGFAPSVNAQPVAHGLPTAADLAVGTFIQVEGRFVEGVLQAKQIEVYAAPLEEETLDAAVEAVDLDEQTLTVAGRRVSISAETKIRDADKEPLELFEVEVGQMAKSKGFRDEEGTLLAHRVRVKPEPSDAEKASKVKIKAPIEELDADAQTMVVFDMKVKYSPQTEYKVGN